MTAISINMPAATHLRNVGGKSVKLDWSKVPAGILPAILEVGAKTVLTNAFNGGGKGATEAEKLAAMEKKMAAWYRGEFNVVSRGESGMGALKEQYIDERRADTGASRADVERAIKATVASVFGRDESATFGKFLDAVAALKCRADDNLNAADVREELEAALAERAEKAAQARVWVRDKIDTSSIDLASLGL